MDIFDRVIITDIAAPFIVRIDPKTHGKMRNRRMYGLCLCIRGNTTYYLDGMEFTADANHAVLLPIGRSYRTHSDIGGVFPMINFLCEGLSCDTARTFTLKNPELCLSYFRRMQKLSLFRENRLELFSVFYTLLHTIGTEQSPAYTLLHPVIEYIENHLSDPSLDNAALAKRAGISEVYLRKVFLSQMHLTPKQYILRARMEKAKQLLSESACRIGDVAEECGFSSPYHFSRAFKSRTGLSPTQFASQNKLFEI